MGHAYSSLRVDEFCSMYNYKYFVRNSKPHLKRRFSFVFLEFLCIFIYLDKLCWFYGQVMHAQNTFNQFKICKIYFWSFSFYLFFWFSVLIKQIILNILIKMNYIKIHAETEVIIYVSLTNIYRF